MEEHCRNAGIVNLHLNAGTVNFIVTDDDNSNGDISALVTVPFNVVSSDAVGKICLVLSTGRVHQQQQFSRVLPKF